MNVAVLLSGGVDSAVVVHRLKEQGIDPTLFYIRIGMDNDEGDCSAEEDIEMCTYIARKYGLPFEVVSLHREYWDHVMEYALRTVKLGLTPNPDMMCNKMIKFGFFEERWGHAFDKTATGHYATTTERNGKIYLSTARDKKKDQTDFLAQIDSVQVSHLLFPIGDLLKQEVREMAVSAKLPNASRRDSQGICFLGNIDYNAFIRRHLGERQGAIVELETGKILGSGILVSYDRTTEGTRIKWWSVVRRGERCRYQYDIRIERVWNGETIWKGFKVGGVPFYYR